MKKILYTIVTENFSWGVGILASLAQEYGWEVDILYIPKNGGYELFIEKSQDYHPDLLAISFMSYDRKRALDVAAHAKKIGIKAICGGVHPTFMAKDVAHMDLFNAIVVGDGTGVWKDMLDNYNNLPINTIIKGKGNPDKTLYTKQFYSSSQIEDMKQSKTAMLLSSYGCPFKCSFCASSSLKYLANRPEEIVDMMSRIYNEYGVNNFQFFDDLFASTAQRCRNIHNKVIEHFGVQANIKYGNFVMARASGFNKAIAAELVKMGVECVNFGIETASPKLLKFLRKGQTYEDAYNAMNICKEYGLIRKVNLMFAIPTQDEEDYEYTLNFVEKTNPEIKSCFYFCPLPGSELYDYCFDNNYLPGHCDRERFNWFTSMPDGFADLQFKMNNIDYEMAADYRRRIEQVGIKKDYLKDCSKALDEFPWIIIGSSKTYYYKVFLEKLSKFDFNNCLGYIDTNKEGAYAIHGDFNLSEYDSTSSRKPLVCVTYCYLGGGEFQFMQRAVWEIFGEIPLVSLASWKNHNKNDIEHIVSSSKSSV